MIIKFLKKIYKCMKFYEEHRIKAMIHSGRGWS